MMEMRVNALRMRCRRSDKLVWLRVYRVDGNGRETLELSECSGAAHDEIDCRGLQAVKLSQDTRMIRLEVWVSTQPETGLLQFTGSRVVDIQTVVSGDEQYDLLRATPTPHKAYATALVRWTHLTPTREPTDIEPAELETSHATSGGFKLTIPSKPVRQRSRLGRIRVAEVMQECQLGVLQELLPTTLHGKVDLPPSQPSTQAFRLVKAMQLLQLSCQYASHCCSALDESQRELETRCDYLARSHRALLQRRSRLLDHKQNLKHELSVLECSMDGMKMLLQEVDPVVSQRLNP